MLVGDATGTSEASATSPATSTALSFATAHLVAAHLAAASGGGRHVCQCWRRLERQNRGSPSGVWRGKTDLFACAEIVVHKAQGILMTYAALHSGRWWVCW